jgi:hypothetical protein
VTTPHLQPEICRECDKPIGVAPYSPWDGTPPDGCSASCWDSEACSEYHVGWICLECAMAAAMRTGDEPGIRGMLGGPGPDWEFSYTKGGK